MEEERFELKKVGSKLVVRDKSAETDLDLERAVNKLNYLEKLRKNKSSRIHELQENQRLCLEIIDGVRAYFKLKRKGLIWDDDD